MTASDTKHGGKIYAKAVGAYLPRVAKAVFEKHGFPSAEIIAEWETIAGSDLARFTSPERIIWPQRYHRDESQDQTAHANRGHRRHGATLVLRVEGPRALEVQHCTAQIIDRINSVFGYRAIASIRLQQGPVSREDKTSSPSESGDSPHDESWLERIEDDDLRSALARLGAHIARE